MTTPNNAAALERLEQKWREEAAAEWTHCQNKELSEWVRDRCYGQHNRLLSCAAELAALRATLTQPDALTVRIAHKGPSDFPNHQCPAESSAVWNACCMEHERVLAGKAPMLTTTALTSQPSGEATDRCQCGAPCRKEVLMRGGDNGWGDDASRTILRYVPPTHPSADAPEVAVDDEMVDRAAKAYCKWFVCGSNGVSTLALRAALIAALAPKPEGGHD